MRSKAPLLLMEQMIMLLVFALAAALCLQAFALSDGLSRRSEARDRAVTLAQTAAETIRHQGGAPESALNRAAGALGGRYENGVLTLTRGEGEETLTLTARPVPTEVPGLAKAAIRVERQGEVLFEIEAAWQEVAV